MAGPDQANLHRKAATDLRAAATAHEASADALDARQAPLVPDLDAKAKEATLVATESSAQALGGPATPRPRANPY
jgi:hypothetical protein